MNVYYLVVAKHNVTTKVTTVSIGGEKWQIVVKNKTLKELEDNPIVLVAEIQGISVKF